MQFKVVALKVAIIEHILNDHDIYLRSPNSSNGESWIALSNGCPLQVGSEPDYYYSASGVD